MHGKGDDQPYDEYDGPPEIAMIGDLTDGAADIAQKLLEVPPGEECVIYFDSPGGSAYGAVSFMSLIRLRGLRATGVVTGECSSAALWPFAACTRRLVTAHSVLLFHPMKWQSEEHVAFAEAAEWARHFQELEVSMDQLLASTFGMDVEKLREWMKPGRYVSGPELAAEGVAELIEIAPLDFLRDDKT